MASTAAFADPEPHIVGDSPTPSLGACSIRLPAREVGERSHARHRWSLRVVRHASAALALEEPLALAADALLPVVAYDPTQQFGGHNPMLPPDVAVSLRFRRSGELRFPRVQQEAAGSA
jgi:hypothetical protein